MARLTELAAGLLGLALLVGGMGWGIAAGSAPQVSLYDRVALRSALFRAGVQMLATEPLRGSINHLYPEESLQIRTDQGVLVALLFAGPVEGEISATNRDGLWVLTRDGAAPVYLRSSAPLHFIIHRNLLIITNRAEFHARLAPHFTGGQLLPHSLSRSH